MGKKKKKSSNSPKTSNNVAPSYGSSLLSEILINLLSIKESNGLVIGTNAVLRAIEKHSVDVVLLVKRKASSVIFHTLSLWCNNTNTLLLQIHDDSMLSLHPRVCKSTTYGIKTNALSAKEKFSNLIERISIARNSLKLRKEKRDNVSSISDSEISKDLITNAKCENVTEKKVFDSNNDHVKDFIHEKHLVTKAKFIGKAEAFISLDEYSTSDSDFPNYSVISKKISVSIK